MSNAEIIMSIEGVTKKFPLGNGKFLTACDDITLHVRKGEFVAIVGESGCGKTTLMKSVMNIQSPTSGRIIYKGEDITKLTGEAKRQNCRNIQMVFQNPSAAFNPKLKVKEIICEPLLNFGLVNKSDMAAKAGELLEMVDLPKEFAERYPNNMSGGQRQRVAIARALALEPEIIVCDEATSAWDVSVQDTIIKLLCRLQKEKGVTFIFICHDLALVSLFAHRVTVMYLGNIMEKLDGDKLQGAVHPYTRALLRSVFPVHGDKSEVQCLEGNIPNPADMPVGCPFQTRCAYCQDLCRTKKPALQEVGENHYAACHFPLLKQDF